VGESAATTAPNAWQKVARAFAQPSALTMFLLGFGSGLPFLLVGGTLSIWLRDVGLDLGAIGLVRYISLIYTLKFFWAPVLDRSAPPPLLRRLGRRRGWLLTAQLLVAIALAGMALFGPQSSMPVFLALMSLTAFAGASQDTVVDAYRIEIAPLEAQGALAATYSFGYRLGLIAAGAGALYTADVIDWPRAYLAMAALMLVPIAATLFAREPAEPSPATTVADRPAGLDGYIAPVLARVPVSWRDVTGRVLLSRFIAPFLDFLRRNGVVLALALLAFVGLYKLPDQMLGVIAGPF
jgi:PAT family beta-lactamase induction signal transducer AmpG